MAEQALGVVTENISDLIQREFGLLWGVEEDLEKLSSTLATVKMVLEDSETKHVSSKATENWLLKLKHAAEEANRVLDEWSTQAGDPKSKFTKKTHTKQVSMFIFSCLNCKQIAFRHKIGKRIQELIITFNEIAEERSKFHLSTGVDQKGHQLEENRETTSVLTREVYGRDEDKEKILKSLLSNANGEDVSVLPILGVADAGKTTVAQLVYNDGRVAKHFDTRIWVWVSKDFEVKRLIKTIIESSTGKHCDTETLDMMQKRLKELLDGKRFLLVLDDVWNQNKNEWNKLKYTLKYGRKGSSVLVTTRLKEVASVMGTIPAHCVNPLPEKSTKE